MKRSLLFLSLMMMAGCGGEPLVADDTACGSELTCDRATEVCVNEQGITLTHRCLAVPDACDGDRACGCVAEAACGTDVRCLDEDEDNTVTCCPKCGTAAEAGEAGQGGAAAEAGQAGRDGEPVEASPSGPAGGHDSL